jgi:hypothetical protein
MTVCKDAPTITVVLKPRQIIRFTIPVAGADMVWPSSSNQSIPGRFAAIIPIQRLLSSETFVNTTAKVSNVIIQRFGYNPQYNSLAGRTCLKPGIGQEWGDESTNM